MYITGHRQTNPIDFGECQIYIVFLQKYKKFSYTLQPMESNSLKDSSIQTAHFTELKFGMYIISHHRIKAAGFGEFLMHSFLQEYKKYFLYITAYGDKNSLRGSST